MMIQAKYLKVGQDVKFGNEWLKVEKLIQGTQKNGKGFVNVCGTIYKGNIKAGSGYKSRIIESRYCDYNSPKLETKVLTR
jgi:hypothetical protein